jgi:hypothetical protein
MRRILSGTTSALAPCQLALSTRPDDEIVGEGVADMFQEELHHRRVDCRHNQGGHFPFGWCHSGIGVGVLPYLSFVERVAARQVAPTRVSRILTRPKRPSSSAIFNTGR